jgi:hypothetical protein
VDYFNLFLQHFDVKVKYNIQITSFTHSRVNWYSLRATNMLGFCIVFALWNAYIEILKLQRQQKKLDKHISDSGLYIHTTPQCLHYFQCLLIDICDMRISIMNRTTAMKEPMSEPEMRPQK